MEIFSRIAVNEMTDERRQRIDQILVVTATGPAPAAGEPVAAALAPLGSNLLWVAHLDNTTKQWSVYDTKQWFVYDPSGSFFSPDFSPDSCPSR